MAIKSDTLVMAAVVIIAIVLLKPATDDTTPTTNGGIDLCKLVESEVSFTGQTMFNIGTARPQQHVRVIRENGDGTIKDKGLILMDSGTTDTKPKASYTLYFGENSSAYYTHPLDYTAPCEDATDDKTGILCTIDTTPSITVFDEFGRPMTVVGTNDQTIGTGESVDVSVQVKVSADQCFGNPYAPKKNAICFGYNSTAYESVSVIGGTALATPFAVAANSVSDVGGLSQVYKCFELDLLKDVERATLNVNIKAASSINPGGVNNNISVTVNDIAFDLDADTLDEIWDFQDEDDNELGITTITTPVWFDMT